MQREQLPITALPAWSKLNDVDFIDIKVQDSGEAKGFALVTECALSSKDIFDVPTLLRIPLDLVLSAEFIEEHAKVDQHFRQLLDAAGGKSTRGDILLFLLLQLTIGSPNHVQNIGISTAWTAYTKMLPNVVPVPTCWTEEERIMLAGTSLETAVDAKLAALLREFETLRERTVAIEWCRKCWWDNEVLELGEWVLVDSWWRSRSLELPSNVGECMIPCIDMVNHSSKPNAYYEHSSNGVSLLMRPDEVLQIGSEVTISYGDSKSEAEMLFSYGFIDQQQTQKGLVLTIDPFPDDPFAKAKISAFAGPRVVRFSADQDTVQWESEFLYLMLLNEEDGLDFRVLQQTDGSRSQLRVFWQGADVTGATKTFESLVSGHALSDVFQLRAVALLQDRIRQQLERLYEKREPVEFVADSVLVRPDRSNHATYLRKSETTTLEKAFAALDIQKSKLLESEVVLRYLGSMEGEGPEAEQAYSEEAQDDFS